APVATGDPNRFLFYVNVFAVGSALPTDAGHQLTVPFNLVANGWAYQGDGATSGGTPPGDTVTLSNLKGTNDRSYLDVIFFPSRGATLTADSIVEPGTELPEFSLGGVGAGLPAKRVTVVGAPSALGNNVYRYYLQNDFVLGVVTLHFDADAWT